MIYNVPDPPANSKITVEPDVHEYKISWGGRRGGARFILAIVGAVVVAAITGLAQVYPQVMNSSELGVWMLVAAVGMGLVAFASSLVRGYRDFAPESLRFDRDRLVHNVGGTRSGVAAPGNPKHRPGQVEIRRSELREIELRSFGGTSFVALTHAKATREMGWGLPGADREWLVDVIKRWKESAACQESPT